MKKLAFILAILVPILFFIYTFNKPSSNNLIQSDLLQSNQPTTIPFESLLAQGDAKGLGKYFANEVSIIILEKEKELSRSEAIKILIQFFEEHKVQSFKILHQGQSPTGKGKYYIGELKTTKTNFRTYLLIQKEMIQEIRFE